MTLMKRGSKREERPFVQSSPLLSDTYYEPSGQTNATNQTKIISNDNNNNNKQSKKFLKLFRSSKSREVSANKSRKKNSHSYDDEDEGDYYYKDDEDAMKAWEPAPAFLPLPAEGEVTSPQQQRIQITDNETTSQTLAAKQQTPPRVGVTQSRVPQRNIKQTSPQTPARITPSPKIKQQLPKPLQNQEQPVQRKKQHQQSTQRPNNVFQNQSSDALPSVSPSQLKMTKAVLARPFGRESLLVKDCMWMVQVSAAEWVDNTWKYRITIQQRQVGTVQLQDFTNGFTLRSLSNFGWLEKALAFEFHGALLLPSLCISLGIPDDLVSSSQPPEVDSKALASWLSDILNGIRGHGELIISTEKIDLIDSEAMEAFLYRQELAEFEDYAHMEYTPKSQPANIQSPSTASDANSVEMSSAEHSVWDFLLCSGFTYPPEPSEVRTNPPSRTPKMFHKGAVSSRALGDSRTFQLKNSFVESSPTFDLEKSPVARHLALLQAQRDLVWSWRARALGSVELLTKLKEHEKTIGAAWKRFAITISNLFTYEKEMEFSKLGDTKRVKLQSPYRKLHSSTVDECLRVLAKSKMDRSVEGLELLEVMLNAYIGDLSAVHPSMESYLESLHTISMISHEMERNEKQVADEKMSRHDAQDAAVQKFRNNERLFVQSLRTLCQTAPLRTSRMAYKYIEKEQEQAQNVVKSADGMVSKISVATKETATKIMTRHATEEKEDSTTERDLVQRIVSISSNKKFLPPDQNTQEVEKGVELSKDDQKDEAQQAAKRDTALQMCRERMGRWDSKVAMAILNVVGVADANVRVEETTRELRMVRKFAIGLREHMQRCVEALESLQSSMVATDGQFLIQHFVTELQTVLSAMFMPLDIKTAPKIPMELLKKHGIAMNDPLGWLQRSPRSCGNDMTNYLNARESGRDWLINSLVELFNDYNDRVESIESFVYMECVGIQLEKHFSQHRATVLAAFEKKTDISSAINIATRKRLPVLVKDLQAKLETVGADVSHTTVKEAKETHLESKTLKQELSALSMRRLTRAKEISTERVIALMTIWSKEEESSSREEKIALKRFAQSLEYHIGEADLKRYLEASPSPAR